MLRPVGNNLLLASLAPRVITICEGAFQVPGLVELLSVDETQMTAPVRQHEMQVMGKLAGMALTWDTAGEQRALTFPAQSMPRIVPQ
jgi:hypothetical protein